MLPYPLLKTTEHGDFLHETLQNCHKKFTKSLRLFEQLYDIVCVYARTRAMRAY